MKKFLSIMVAVALASMATLISCKPDENGPENGSGTKVEAPVADFSFTANGLEVQFTNSSKHAASYKWDFGDGTDSKEESPRHTYSSAGEYTVKLTVANTEGTTAKKEAKVTVAGAVKAYFSFTPKTDRAGKFGKIVSFNATSSENAASIAWDFGDGQTGSEFQMDHEFPDYGSYKVKATVTGLAGDTDVYEETVEAVAHNEILKGGSMEEEDAKYWTFAPIWAPKEGSYDEVIEGLYCWQPYFGHKGDGPAGGEGGCLRLSSENQTHDWANNVRFYQGIEVVEGDVLAISCEAKWGERTNDNGLFWIRICDTPDDFAVDANGVQVFNFFNYWGAGSDPVPAFDGNFAGNEAWNAQREKFGSDCNGEKVAYYTVTKTGTIYLGLEYRSVWGPIFVPGIDIFIDNVSVKVNL